jgi:hypothetical protein
LTVAHAFEREIETDSESQGGQPFAFSTLPTLQIIDLSISRAA